MRNTLELPIYTANEGRKDREYHYVRIDDVEDENMRERFTKFMFGQTQPLIQLPDRFLTDAVFYWDYERFQRVLEGEEKDELVD